MDIGLSHATTTTLESRFDDLDLPILLTGIQALVRVLLEQARLDRAAGLNTGGLVSGYRGSPLGGLDLELWRRAKLLTEHNIRFQPGVNEDLAATMLYGTQLLDAFPGKRVDGVIGMWYAKAPASIAPAMRCTAATCWAPRVTAACWRYRATTTARIRPPIRTRPSMCFREPTSQCSIPHRWRTSSISGSPVLRCRATAACGSR